MMNDSDTGFPSTREMLIGLASTAGSARAWVGRL